MNITEVKRFERLTIDIEDAEPFELPTTVYGGSGNGGKLGREAYNAFVAEHGERARLPHELISPYTWQTHRVVVEYENGVQTRAVAYGPHILSLVRVDFVPSEHWPQWLIDAVEAVVTSRGLPSFVPAVSAS